LTKFPLFNEVILYTGWIDVGNRIDAKWERVEFFVNKFRPIYPNLPTDKLYDEFCE